MSDENIGSEDSGHDQDRHTAKMMKKKAVRDRIMETKNKEKGLIIVHTGKGKGKSTAAFGMIFRCIAHHIPCAVVQYIKGGMETGERNLIQDNFADFCQFHTIGEGFTWETQDRERDMLLAQKAWKKSMELICDGHHKFILLDEINIALRYGYLELSEIVNFLQEQKPHDVHVVCTGRNAAQELLDIADLATEMTLLKHPFRDGVRAQSGIEF